MSLLDIAQIVNTIAVRKKIDSDSIYEDAINYLQEKYGFEKTATLNPFTTEAVKQKVLATLFLANRRGIVLCNYTNLYLLFHLNTKEAIHLNNALAELESEGVIRSALYNIVLTRRGKAMVNSIKQKFGLLKHQSAFSETNQFL